MTGFLRLIAITAVAALSLAAQGAATATKKAPATKPHAAAGADTKKGSTAGSAAEKPGGMIDINTASAEELRQVPGIGEAYSAKIISGRPYKAKNELVSKGVLPAGVYAKVKDRLVAHQAKK